VQVVGVVSVQTDAAPCFSKDFILTLSENIFNTLINTIGQVKSPTQ
jgi:hypothetical protein